MMTAERAARLTQRGYQFHKRGFLREALQLYQKVLQGMPAYPDAWHHAALATRQLCAHARNKGLPAPWDASTLMMVRAIEESQLIVEQLERMASPELATATKLFAAMVFNFAWFQQDRGILEGDNGARVMYEEALELDQELGEGWTNLGNVYGELGNDMRAEACWLRALETPASSPEARFNLSFLMLRRGMWRTGWAMYEARWESPVFLASYGRPEIDAPRWNGEQLRDGRLLLHAEQGAGDAIMSARWIPHCAARCARVTIEVHQPLVRLFQEAFRWPWVEIVERGEDLPKTDAELPMMSLPAVFGALPDESLPDPAISLPLAPERGRIGLCWRGSPTHQNDRNRSMPVDAIAPLLELTRVRHPFHGERELTWQSLQFGADDVAGLQPLISIDYLDTAREIARCELVITVDTSVAHLAASMGVPTWILLPYFAEWRWMDGARTPWYRSARLWRQKAPGDWTELVNRVRLTLATGWEDYVELWSTEAIAQEFAKPFKQIDTPFSFLVDDDE